MGLRLCQSPQNGSLDCYSIAISTEWSTSDGSLDCYTLTTHIPQGQLNNLCFLPGGAIYDFFYPTLGPRPLVMERPRARNLHIACIDTVHIICSDTGQHRRGACPRCSGQNFSDDTHRISAAISATIDEAQAREVQAITSAMRYIPSSASMPFSIDKSTRRKPRP